MNNNKLWLQLHRITTKILNANNALFTKNSRHLFCTIGLKWSYLECIKILCAISVDGEWKNKTVKSEIMLLINLPWTHLRIAAVWPHADINECLNSDACSLQVCTNTNGSYTCSCNPGYILSADMKTCAGYSIV